MRRRRRKRRKRRKGNLRMLREMKGEVKNSMRMRWVL